MLRRNLAWIAAAVFAAGVVFALVTPAQDVRKDIGNEELTQLQSGGAFLVDVRSPAEYATGYLAGAVNVPLTELSQAAKSWDKSRPIVVYCATGARSANAAISLSALGFKKVYNLSKGVVAWNAPLVTGSPGAAAPTGPSNVKTNGKPLFIDFASSN